MNMDVNVAEGIKEGLIKEGLVKDRLSTNLERYRGIVEDGTIEEIYLLGEYLSGLKVQHVNSTFVGGGVAEILNRMVPMFNSLGIDTTWEVIKGDEPFFRVTKGFHNALQGMDIHFKQEDYGCYLDYNKKNANEIKIDGDVVFVHDPQPAALIEYRNGGNWIWRCHIDISNPNVEAWNFLKRYVVQYDCSIFSSPKFARCDIPTRQFLVPPSIDPLSDKNKELSESEIDRVLTKFELKTSKPIITQISRFDRYKDPAGVIRAFKMVKKHVDAQLVLAGSLATDDPEGTEVYNEIKSLAQDDKDIHLLLLPPFSDIEINALQRASAVVLQKSIKEGFGLTVSEALWKGRPVIAGDCGGIPLQIKNGYTGFLTHTIEGTAYKIRYLLNNPKEAKRMGNAGREHVRRNFLLTRHLRDYLMIIATIRKKEKVVKFE